MTEAGRPIGAGEMRMESIVVPIATTPSGYRIAKRTMDIVASSVGLIATAPMMLAIAVAVRLDTHGPVLFKQNRIGLGGRPFRLYKFRTMHASADEEAHRRYVRRLIRARDETTDSPNATWVPLEGDARVTRIGTFLRRSHLDELPQLVNVLRGEMSVVGPRPPIPYEVELYEPWHLRRLSVTPGLTGLWQLRGWGKLSFDEGVALDLEYVERRSFMGDVGITLGTIWQIIRGRQF